MAPPGRQSACAHRAQSVVVAKRHRWQGGAGKAENRARQQHTPAEPQPSTSQAPFRPHLVTAKRAPHHAPRGTRACPPVHTRYAPLRRTPAKHPSAHTSSRPSVHPTTRHVALHPALRCIPATHSCAGPQPSPSQAPSRPHLVTAERAPHHAPRGTRSCPPVHTHHALLRRTPAESQPSTLPPTPRHSFTHTATRHSRPRMQPATSHSALFCWGYPLLPPPQPGLLLPCPAARSPAHPVRPHTSSVSPFSLACQRGPIMCSPPWTTRSIHLAPW